MHEIGEIITIYLQLQLKKPNVTQMLQQQLEKPSDQKASPNFNSVKNGLESRIDAI